jgi:EmrB/QacA subfamily drug resistance transporter
MSTWPITDGSCRGERPARLTRRGDPAFLAASLVGWRLASYRRGMTMPRFERPFLHRRPRRRGLASVNAESRDGIVPAAGGMATTADLSGGVAGSRSYRTIALIVATSLFMEFLDATVLATALPTMARDFGVRAPEMSVALTAYLLALAIFIPASGTMADRFGARRVFASAIGVFALGSIGCGLAPSLAAVIAARFAQGLGGAMMLPVGRLVLLRSVAKADLVSAMSWLLVPALIGPIFGPPIGGLIITYLDWRWIFWINVPIALVGIALVMRFIPEIRDAEPHPFDGTGFLLSGLGLGSLLAGFELAARPGEAVTSAALVALGAVSGALYVRHARRHPHPILDLTLMRVPTFRLSVVAGSLTRITQGAQPYLLPLMMQLGFGLSAAQSGLVTVAPAIGSFAMKSGSRLILRRFGFRRSLMVVGLLASAGYAGCALFRPGWPLPAIFAVLLVSGFLMSFQFTAYNTIAYDEIAKDRMSAATSFYSTFQQLMLSLGICVAAVSLHAATLLRHHAAPVFGDYGAAYLVVTAISLSAILFNRALPADAGDELAGRTAR